MPSEPSEPSVPQPVPLDLADFDAVGIASDIVVAVRSHGITAGVDATAWVETSEPGWHSVVVTGRPSGHVVLSVRYGELTTSRWHNVARALAQRGWQPDDDNEGATQRYSPGSEASTAAFELLAVATLAGAPADVRQVTAVDALGSPVDLAV